MKKLREEHENLSDLMFEDYRSSSESINSNDALPEQRNRWHSAEDVRTRKHRSSVHRDSAQADGKRSHSQRSMAANNNDSFHECNETPRTKYGTDVDIDQIVVENKHFRMVIAQPKLFICFILVLISSLMQQIGVGFLSVIY